MIPQSFQIMGHTVTVKITDDLPEGADGLWSAGTNEIRICPASKKLSKSNQEQIFWHEVVHCIFDMLSYEEYSKDEKLVDRVAQCLYQTQTTRTGRA